jgi:hypothetical protein
MTSQREIAEAQEVLQSLLRGAGFSGFAFGCNFRLWFDRVSGAPVDGVGDPQELELTIEANWRIGDEADWQAKVRRLAPEGAVEPEEPVQAYELALMRWSEGSNVSDVVLKAGELRVTTRGGATIVIGSSVERGETAWCIGQRGVPEHEATWSVCCVDGVVYVKGSE